ncbi:MAG: hypothetical protein EPN94_11080 [Nitrospirae bacterium]|nr:MAG: hypothetical protein EPN94_11080 [Nitrospirota bacterium]
MNAFLQRLAEIYREIDKAYTASQAHYNFNCEGCADNCCVTKFHHHTIVEELYLAEGLKKLSPEKTGAVISRAEEVVKIHEASPEDIRVICPLNEDGLCIPYANRPMICRIHGLPYELFRNFKFETGDGCYRFITEKENTAKDFRINRTAFYLDIAQTEREVREKLNFTGRYKKTTAEMVLSIYGRGGQTDDESIVQIPQRSPDVMPTNKK